MALVIKGVLLERRPGGPFAVRDCALVLYKSLLSACPSIGVLRQKVVNIVTFYTGPYRKVPFPLCGFDTAGWHSHRYFFFHALVLFFLDIPCLDFSFYHVVIPELCFLYTGNTHVVILDFMMESQVSMKNESGAA